MDSGLEEITEDELIQAFISANQTMLQTAMPCKVEAYDASKQTVDVVPALNRSLPDGNGNYVTEALPKLSDVPVAFPRGGGFFIALPIAAGDYGLLVFCSRNIGNWRSTGNQGDPGDLGMHTLDGAVFIPGLFPDSGALSNADGTNMVIGKDGTPAAQIVIKPSGEIDLGGSTYSLPQWDSFATVFKTATAAVAALTPATDPATTLANVNSIAAALKTLNTALGLNNNYKSTVVKNG